MLQAEIDNYKLQVVNLMTKLEACDMALDKAEKASAPAAGEAIKFKALAEAYKSSDELHLSLLEQFLPGNGSKKKKKQKPDPFEAF